jgi:hypothetical protein
MFRRIYNHLRGNGLPPLGRWCLKDKSKNDWKIDSANTDHCGTCSYEQPVPLPKIESVNPIRKINTTNRNGIPQAVSPDRKRNL